MVKTYVTAIEARDTKPTQCNPHHLCHLWLWQSYYFMSLHSRLWLLVSVPAELSEIGAAGIRVNMNFPCVLSGLWDPLKCVLPCLVLLSGKTNLVTKDSTYTPSEKHIFPSSCMWGVFSIGNLSVSRESQNQFGFHFSFS